MNAKPKHAPCSCGEPRGKPWHLACAKCWALVPAPLQKKVFTLFKTARGSGDHIAAVRECHEAIRSNRPGRAVTPPHLLCTLPYGMPCLARKEVMAGTLEPCEKCAPHLDKTRKLFAGLAVVKSGYGGVNKAGRIVDRRDELSAVPMAENALLDIPKPLKP